MLAVNENMSLVRHYLPCERDISPKPNEVLHMGRKHWDAISVLDASPEKKWTNTVVGIGTTCYSWQGVLVTMSMRANWPANIDTYIATLVPRASFYLVLSNPFLIMTRTRTD